MSYQIIYLHWDVIMQTSRGLEFGFELVENILVLLMDVVS